MPATATATNPWRDRASRFFHGLGLLKYAIAVGALILLLPLSAYPSAPFHNMLGGIFRELTPANAFWFGLSAAAAAWGLMWVTALLVEDLNGYQDQYGREYLPSSLQNFLNLKVSYAQFWSATALTLPCLFTVCVCGTSTWGNSVGFGGGILAGFLALVLACTPAALMKSDFNPLPFRWLIRFWAFLRPKRDQKKRGFVWRLVFWGYHLFLRPNTLPNFKSCYCLGTKSKHMAHAHFLAFTNFMLLIIVCAGLNWGLYPGAPYSAGIPAGAYVFAVFALLVWLFGYLAFFLRRWGLSPLWVFFIISWGGYVFTSTDHTFEARVVKSGEAIHRITPVEAAQTATSNLVLVAASGGGILAAGWTTWTLQELCLARPRLTKEIRLISGASGGSVGAAYWVQGLLHADDVGEKHTDPECLFAQIFKNATASSLDSIAYGLAFLDFPRLASGGLSGCWTKLDRGRMLEQAWRRTAENSWVAPGCDHALSKGASHSINPSLLSLNSLIAKGTVPAIIFNATAVETGERVMLTGTQFPEPGPPCHKASPASPIRLLSAPTLSDYYGLEVDLSLWTAARLSASFPYVTPVSQAQFKMTNAGGGLSPLEAFGRAKHHFADGGYYDNYGVSAVLDWLEPVLWEKWHNPGKLPFQRVLILQLRAYATQTNTPPIGGGWAAYLGPLETLMNVYSASAKTRNERELERYIASWNARFAAQANPVVITNIVLERDSPFGPLSWHLTSADINGINRMRTNEHFMEIKTKIQHFLNGELGVDGAKFNADLAGSGGNPSGH